jgi:zinc-ribbon domain
MHCIKCGSSLPDGATFCPGCGQAQKKMASSYLAIGSAGFLIALAIVAVFVIAVIVGLTHFGPALVNPNSSSRPLTDRIVIDWHGLLKDGEAMSWRLPAGSYRLELTASDDGDSVEWIGGNCPATQPMKAITTTCEMPRDGQLVVRNPTTFGLGAASMTTVKLTRIGVL